MSTMSTCQSSYWQFSLCSHTHGFCENTLFASCHGKSLLIRWLCKDLWLDIPWGQTKMQRWAVALQPGIWWISSNVPHMTPVWPHESAWHYSYSLQIEIRDWRCWIWIVYDSILIYFVVLCVSWGLLFEDSSCRTVTKVQPGSLADQILASILLQVSTDFFIARMRHLVNELAFDSRRSKEWSGPRPAQKYER